MSSMPLTCCIGRLQMQQSRTSRPQGLAAHRKCRSSLRCDECKAPAFANGKCAMHNSRAYRVANGQVDVKCSLCGEKLANYRGATLPLHQACKDKVPAWRRQGRESPKVRAFRARIEKAALGTSSNRVFTCGDCDWCGEYFVGIGKTCSKKCSASAKFARRSSGMSFNISPRDRLEIYERDGWVCQLCNFPVEQGLHFLNDWAPSLDHIIPQALTLIPDHSPSNLQLAHRMCNSMKGDGSNMAETEFHRRISQLLEVAA